MSPGGSPTEKTQSKDIQYLPNEILSMIFEFAFWLSTEGADDSARVTLTRTVSQVCRRFRSVALHTPQLWSVISNWQSRDEIAASLIRSNTADLWICCTQYRRRGRRSSPIEEMLTLILPHSRRWHSLWVQMDDALAGSSEALREMQHLSLCAGYQFPRLTDMWISGCDGSLNHLMNTNAAFHMAGISFPNLATFRGRNILPGLKHAGLLTTIVLDISHKPAPNTQEQLNLMPVVRLLQTSTQLKTCRLRVHVIGSAHAVDANIPIVSQHLTSLTVDILINDTTSVTPLVNIMQTLKMPNIETLAFTMKYRSPFVFYLEDDRCLEALPIFSSNGHATGNRSVASLREVYVKFSSSEVFLQEIFNMIEIHAPNLERLNVEAKKLTLDVSSTNFHFPSLPSITHLLLRNMMLTDAFVQRFLEWRQSCLDHPEKLLFTVSIDRDRESLESTESSENIDNAIELLTEKMGSNFKYSVVRGD